MEFLDPATELRKLRPSHVKELAKTLESGESWKNLMSRIPEKLDRFDYNCDISVQNRNKYHSEHYRLIQTHSEKTRTSCTEILFDEWGTSGRVRPTLGHLLHLLTKAELFRAADYLAGLLDQPKPPRPTSGPARRINVELEEVVEEIRNVEEAEEVSEYVKDAIQAIRRNSEETAKIPLPRTIPVIKISLSVDEEEKPESREEPVPMVVQLPNARRREVPEQVMEKKGVQSQKVETKRESKVSESDNEKVISQVSIPLQQSPEPQMPVTDSGNDSKRIPNFQKINETQTFASDDSERLPDFQKINETSSVISTQLPDFQMIQSEVSYQLNESINHSIVSEVSRQLPDFQKINQVSQSQSYNSSELPDFANINDSTELESTDQDSRIIYTTSEDISSALPNFSEINRNYEGSKTSQIGYSISEISENATNAQTAENVESSEVVSGVSSEQLPNFSGLLNHSGITQNLNASENSTVEEDASVSWGSSIPLPISAENSDNLCSTQLPNFNSLTSSNATTPGCSLKCSSPLPQLSLRTSLPHIPYSTLVDSTNNFDSDNFTTPDQPGRLLGSGAFGSVFVGFGVLSSVPVAIKKLKLESLVRDVTSVELDDTVTKQFRNEVEVLSRYEHENLLSLLGYSCDGCTYCLVYEYIPGGALKDRLMLSPMKPLDWKTRLKIAVGTARSIAYLHTAFDSPLVHRDVKSANILLDESDNPKLGDFGLIRLSSSSPTITADSCGITTTIFGTSAYMAPEAFGGDVSIKMDVFSFGVVLLELLTSLPAMDIEREDRDLVTHIKSNCDTPDDILTLLDYKAGTWEQNNIHFSKEIYNIASKCLEIKKKRPPMVQVRDHLEELVKRL